MFVTLLQAMASIFTHLTDKVTAKQRQQLPGAPKPARSPSVTSTWPSQPFRVQIQQLLDLCEELMGGVEKRISPSLTPDLKVS
jgi:hypothetical protein